jgi:hypothetical protein
MNCASLLRVVSVNTSGLLRIIFSILLIFLKCEFETEDLQRGSSLCSNAVSYLNGTLIGL